MGIALFCTAVGASICASVSAGKNRNVIGWALLGALLPLISIIIICSLPPEPAPAATGGALPPA